MKKILAMILALAMILSMSTFAFAADLDENGAENNNVNVTVTEPGKVYKVSITWESLDFVYELGAWDTSKHEYTGGSWQGNRTSAKITVINHSNAAVTVSAATTNQNSVTDVTVTYPEEGAFELKSAAEYAYGSPDAVDKANAKVYTVSVAGTPKQVVSETLVGKITVTISNIPDSTP